MWSSVLGMSSEQTVAMQSQMKFLHLLEVINKEQNTEDDTMISVSNLPWVVSFSSKWERTMYTLSGQGSIFTTLHLAPSQIQ